MDFGPLIGGVVFILVGVFVITHVVFGRDRYWDMHYPRFKEIVELLGETGVMRVRIFWGVVCVIIGVLMLIWFVSEMIGL